jgi:predicted ATPase/class 3 adenylate cyclase
MTAQLNAETEGLPTGTVTFLFTDIEGSTKLLRRLGDSYPALLDEHHRILAEAVEGHGGHRVGTEGDALFAVFESAPAAVAAATEAQRALHAHQWSHGEPVSVRMGLHTGQGRLSATNYVGLDVHRAARIASSGHGGQVVLSESTQALAQHALPDGVTLRDLGQHRLKDLEHPEHVFQLVVAGLPWDFAALRSLDARPNNLPALMTNFVGREREVEAVKKLIETTRLLTLTGPGGTGKTRLSLEAAADLLPDFADGVFFVRLAAIRDPALIPSTIAQAMSIPEALDRPMLDAVEDYLREREVLLVLDNFEQIIAGGSIVAELLAAAPKLKVMVSSREILHLSGEQELPVPPMDLPDPRNLPDLDTLSRYDALALFVQRARAVDPAFGLTDRNAAAVAEICARLDGLPLAIELATARLKLLQPEAILQRLEKRLPLLKGGARDLPERQQTLQNAIAWSYDLLEPDEQVLFRRLGAFMGGWQLPAAEAVTGADVDLDILDGMSSLVDKSLVRQATDAGDEPRFWMLETIREYAADRLEESGELAEVARRHAEFFLALAEEGEPHLTATDQSIWIEGFQREIDNMRAALSWTVDQRAAEMGFRIGAALWRFWQFRGHLEEGRIQMELLLGLPEGAVRTVARARGLDATASILYWQGDYPRARALYDEALSIYRELGDPRGMAQVLYSLGFVAGIELDYAAARVNYEESRTVARQIGDRRLEAYNNLGVALVAQITGGYQEALAVGRDSLPLFEELGEKWAIANIKGVMGRSWRRLNEYERARAALRESIRMFQEMGDLPGITWTLDDIGDLELHEAHFEQALRLAGAAEAFRKALGARAPIALTEYEDPRPKIRGQLDDAAMEEAWAKGAAMTVDEAVAHALQEERAPAP